MRPILIDTDACTAFMLGDAAVVETVAHAERICLRPDMGRPCGRPVPAEGTTPLWVGLSRVVPGEWPSGFAAGTRESKSRAALARLPDSPRVEVVPVTAQTADSYALVYSGLRRKCQPNPTNDLWIAVGALEHGAALLTRNAHFGPTDGLRRGQRLEDFLP